MRASASRIPPTPPVIVEYDCRGKRTQKTFEDAYAARRWFVAKDKAGRNPRIVSSKPESELRVAAREPAEASSLSPKKAVAAYVRVSTVGQNEDGQKAEIEQWLTGNGVAPESVLWFVDKKSGDNLDRPAFEEMQKLVFSGKVEAVVVWKLDRLSRSLKDGLNVLSDWCDKGLRVVSVTQQIDFNGALGKMLAAVLLGIAEMEQETRRERQAAGIAAAKARGKYLGRKNGTTKAKPNRALALKEKGLTVEEIGKALGVSRNTVFRYIRESRDRCLQSESLPDSPQQDLTRASL
jgi:DNA invertase Pin-like site-specific DNA recombinase